MRRKITGVLFAFLFVIFLASCGSYEANTESSDVQLEDVDPDGFEVRSYDLSAETAASSDEDALFEIRMLDVGQGLSILVESDGEYLLYDGGGRDYSSYVVAYLEENGIEELDYLVASHYDEDHIAGLVGVLNTADVETVLQGDYETDSKIYESYMSAVSSSGAEVIYPEQGYSFSLGGATVTVIGPVSYDYDSDNNNSIVLRIEYGNFSVIMTGDAEEESESDILASGITVASDLYVAGHHGSSSSGSEAFLSAISPSYAFISCGLGNSYGHPHQETMDALLSMGTSMFRTDLQGEVTAYSDGTSAWFSVDPSDDWSSGSTLDNGNSDDIAEKNGMTDSENSGYVLNASSMKFHYANCEAVQKMSDANKEYTDKDRETLITEGYSACGICNP